MKQHRYLKFITAAAGLKPSVVFALFLGACLLTASFRTLSEASEAENPAASSEHSIAFEYGGKLNYLYSMDENQLNELRRNQSDSENALNQVLRVQSDTEIVLEKEVLELSAKLKQLSETADGPASPDPASGDHQANQLAKQLKDAVEKSFNERQRQQLAEIERLTTRLNRLAKSVQRREAEREQIISRKIDELLGKSSTDESTSAAAPLDLDAVTGLPMTIKYFQVPWTEPCRRMMQEIEALQREGFPVVVINMNEENNASNPWQIASVPAVLIEVLQKEVFRNVGFMDRNALRGQVRKILEKQSRLTISSEWQPPQNPNPGEILKEAKADTAAQHYPVALSKYVWYFENALKYDSAQTGVRLSFALNDWMDLAAHYPPALDALKLLRDEAEQRFDDGSKTAHTVMEIAALNRVLNDDERTRAMFETLAENDPTTAKLVFAIVRPSLVKVKAYTLCGKFLDPQQDLERLRRMRQMQSDAGGAMGKTALFDMSALSTQTFAKDAATLIALLVLNDRKQEAENIATTAKSEIADTSLHTIIDAALTGTLPDLYSPASLPTEEKGNAIRVPTGTELETSRKGSVSWDELQSIQESLSASRSAVTGFRTEIKDIRKRLDIFRQPFSSWDSVVRDEFQKEFNEVRSNLRPSADYRGKKFSEDIARLIWEDRKKYEDNKVINHVETPEPNILVPTTDQMLDDVRADLLRMCEERLVQYQSDEQRSLKNWQSQWDSYKARTQLFQLDVDAAEANVTFLAGKLERTKAQQTAGLIDPPEVEKATVELQLAEIQLRKALQLLKLYTAIESNNPELNPEHGDESSAAVGAAEETSKQ